MPTRANSNGGNAGAGYSPESAGAEVANRLPIAGSTAGSRAGRFPAQPDLVGRSAPRPPRRRRPGPGSRSWARSASPVSGFHRTRDVRAKSHPQSGQPRGSESSSPTGTRAGASRAGTSRAGARVPSTGAVGFSTGCGPPHGGEPRSNAGPRRPGTPSRCPARATGVRPPGPRCRLGGLGTTRNPPPPSTRNPGPPGDLPRRIQRAGAPPAIPESASAARRGAPDSIRTSSTRSISVR